MSSSAGPSLPRDDRALSESAGVAILVGITVVVTASVGVNVLVVGETDTGPPSANFTYDYVQQSGTLIVTHSEGDDLEAGKIHFVDGERDVTWAALARTNNTSAVEPGDIVQLGQRNAYGASVSRSRGIEVVYEYEGNRTTLDEWPTEN